MSKTNFMEQYYKEKEEELEKTKVGMKEICKIMFGLGIKEITVRYSGCGDSGDTDEVNFHTDKKVYNSSNLPFQIPASFGSQFANAEDMVGWLSQEATGFIDGDWYNNDGGQGTITIDTEKEHISIEAGYNYMETKEELEEYQL